MNRTAHIRRLADGGSNPPFATKNLEIISRFFICKKLLTNEGRIYIRPLADRGSNLPSQKNLK